MRRTFVILLLPIAVVACARREEPARPKPPPAPAPPKGIYANFPGDDLKGLPADADSPIGRDMRLIHRDYHSGLSNMGLAYAKDIEAAVRVTRWALGSSIGDGPAFSEINPARTGPLWLVAYLGCAGSNPPAWRVHAVEQTGQTVRLTYSRPSAGAATEDVRPYLVWTPIGPPTPGIYTLELFDAVKQQVTFQRRVTVAEPED